MRLDVFMSFLTISYARALSLGVIVGNSVGNYLGDGAASVVVYGFGAVVISS